ncbi:TonB-dependent receptor domain-containing protein [Caulobacter sp. RHG1]|uniref:TonB-dependent receptor domain-containing protein n=1 Tax=Caulobacter sp. (strain RHG1) TaxID=2545762 RepID=UPI0015575B9B|nr:TonB-dependent receptor [Caulobacter sp. RHG1]NQE62652.1 TonB-dependent receptor [Caulobacter sp. RHG1]
MKYRTLLMAAGMAGVCSAAAAETVPADQVDAVVVTASTRAQRLVEAPASISVVTAETLANRPNADLTDALRDVEGVSISGGSNFQDVFIRGLPGSYTLILVDGKRQSTRDSRVNGNSGLEQAFTPPSGAIERIEVVRGPMSSLYGSDAIGGVINIITRKVPDRWGGSIGADHIAQKGKSGNWSQVQGYLAGPLVEGVLGAQIWGRSYARDEDGILNGAGGSKDWNVTGRLAWTPNDRNDVLLQVDRMDVKRSFGPGKTLTAATAANYHTNNRTAGSLSWNGRWDWGTSQLSILREATERANYAMTRGAWVKNVRAPELTNTVADALFNIPLDDTPLGDHQLVVGGQYIKNQLDDVNPGVNATASAAFSVWQRALFVEDEWRLSPQFALTGGLRFDDHERYGSHWSPRLYAVWTPTDAWTVKGGVSTGFRAPELRQVATGYAYVTGGAVCSVGPTGTCGVIIGDPNIKPETSLNFEASVLWNPSSAVSASATVFRTKFKDKIDSAIVYDAAGAIVRWAENPGYRLYYWYNLQDAELTGVELSGRWKPIDALALKAGYTWTDSKQESGTYKGLPLARTPKHMANVRADYTVNDRFNLWGAVNYHGEEINAGLRVGTNGAPLMNGNVQVGRRYPAYTTADIGANWRVTPTVSLKLGVYNLTDKQINVADFDFQGDRRRGWIGVNYEF